MGHGSGEFGEIERGRAKALQTHLLHKRCVTYATARIVAEFVRNYTSGSVEIMQYAAPPLTALRPRAFELIEASSETGAFPRRVRRAA